MNREFNIFEANKYVIEQEFKNYPIIVNDTIVGILTQELLVKEIFNYLKSSAN